MKNTKNGQKAVMESITRKLEAQGIHVRATGAHGRNAVDITTIDSDPDTQCAVEAPQNGRVAGFTGRCEVLR